MDAEAVVAIGKGLRPVGVLRSMTVRGKEVNSFAYAEEWLRSKDAFAMCPALPLAEGRRHFAAKPDSPRAALPGSLSDAGPDGWGRTVIQKAGGGRSEFNFLTAVDDRTRPGALRLVGEDGVPLASGLPPIPRLHDLVRLRGLCEAVDSGRWDEDAMRAAKALRGTADSMGGARPKAVVVDERGAQHLAKFTMRSDSKPVARVEVATLSVARAVGLRACEARLANPRAPLPVALIRRFDRTEGELRVPYMSAQSLLMAEGGLSDARHYTDIADALRSLCGGEGAQVETAELHRRVLFSILVSNTDDHLRNHGLLRGRSGWVLAPAFDINPQPDRAHLMKTGISPDSGFEPSVEAWVESAPLFGRERGEARQEAADMAAAVQSLWPDALRRQGLSAAERKAWQTSVDHPQARAALRMGDAASSAPRA